MLAAGWFGDRVLDGAWPSPHRTGADGDPETVTEIASENKSTTIFPLPLDLFKGLLESGARRTETSALALPENASGSVPAAAARS